MLTNIIIIIAGGVFIGALFAIMLNRAYHMGRAIGALEASTKHLETLIPQLAALQHWTNRAHWEAIQREEKPGVSENGQGDDELIQALASSDLLQKKEKDRLDRADNTQTNA